MIKLLISLLLLFGTPPYCEKPVCNMKTCAGADGHAICSNDCHKECCKCSTKCNRH